MHFDLEADSDETHVALFDAIVVGDAFESGIDLDLLARAQREGRLLFASDAATRLGIEVENVWSLFVDETLPTRLVKYGTEFMADVDLRCESGKLTLASVEWLPDSTAAASARHPEVTTVEVAPGTYAATGWLLDWPDLDRTLKQAVRATVGRWSDWASRAAAVTIPMTCVLGVLGVVLTADTLLRGDEIPVGAAWGVGGVFAAMLTFSAAAWSALRRSDLAWRAARRRYPDVVVALTQGSSRDS